MPQTIPSAQKNRLLCAMTAADADQFFSNLHPVPLSLKQIVYEVGAPLEHVYFVEHGVVSIITKMTTGETIEAGMIGLEGMVGLSALFGNVILRYTGTLLSLGMRTAACNTLHSLQQRTARWLLMMHDRLQADAMPLTHEFLSTMLGTRRTRITEAAGELQRSGLIRYARGIVNILDHPGLCAIACECYRDHDRLLN